MLLLFLNLNIDIGSFRIGLIPNFLGYLFLLNGTSELSIYSYRFSKIKPCIIIMIIFSCAVYVIEFFRISALNDGLAFVFSLILIILSLAISYNIIMGIRDIEKKEMKNLNSDKLYFAWKLLTVCSFIIYLFLFIKVLTIISVIIGFIVGIYYIHIFNKTKKMFYQQNRE